MGRHDFVAIILYVDVRLLLRTVQKKIKNAQQLLSGTTTVTSSAAQPVSILKPQSKVVFASQDAALAAQKSFPLAGKSKGKPKTEKKIAVEVGSPADDMGESLEGIGGEEDDNVSETILDKAFQSFYMLGSAFDGFTDEVIRRDCALESEVFTFAAADSNRRIIVEDMAQLDLYESLLPINDYSVDVVELFGGSAGTAKVLIRRGFVSGGNWDLIAGWNLLRDDHCDALFRYLKRRRPRVIIMAPPCT